MSSTAESESSLEELRAAAARVLGREVFELVRIGGGRNSRVYRAVDHTSHRVALKVYFRHANDDRNRLATEFNSLAFLWERGFRNVPHPIGADPEMNLAVYEYIEGEKIAPDNPATSDLDSTIEFLGRLRELSRLAESQKLGSASEACLSPRLIVDNIQERLRRLSASSGSERSVGALRAFMVDELVPASQQLIRWSQARLAEAGTSFDHELERAERTLSPSDFGFHNALKRPDGRLIFLDFEYFGWDDPAKMIVDFLLHPAMRLSPELKKRFTRGVLCYFPDCPGLMRRVEAVYPLFGLKWCLILLNEFLPEPFLRRQFAGTPEADRSVLQMQQLEKAGQMLGRITSEYDHFPYHV